MFIKSNITNFSLEIYGPAHIVKRYVGMYVCMYVCEGP